MQAASLSATDLACRRGDRVLFSGLSFTMEAGGACRVAGANGIGKSSLIRILAGLASPYAGSVSRVGSIGLIDEKSGLDPAQPLGRALGFWARMDGVVGDCPAATAGRLGIGHLMDVPVRYLSTGQRKRAALTRLIGQSASIWLLDEPLNGLDTKATALVVQLAGEHCAGGGICLIASHQAFDLPGMATLDLAEYAA